MHYRKSAYLILFLCWLPAIAFSQIKVEAPGRKASTKTITPTQARRHAVNPVSLPFWDDFSFVKGDRADSLLWIVNDKVFINDGQAINPPSINVATFDGYNENGVPYSTIPLETGYGDTLESQPIRMADVSAINRDKIYLSFFYQAGGNSEIPNPSDFLKLEFKSTTGWVEIGRFKIPTNADPSRFYDTAIQVPPALAVGQPEYFHNNFQFRFTSFGRISGSYDAWHLDYVYLNRRIFNDVNTSISDRTIAEPFTSIFKNGYHAIPYRHFMTDPEAYLVNPTLAYVNLKDTSFSQVIDQTTFFKIITYKNNSSVVTFNSNEKDEALLPLASRQRSIREIQNFLSATDFVTDADSLDIVVRVGFNSGDNDKDYYSRYVPINFLLNDTVKQTFPVANYYAYDDGVAEYASGLAAQGNQLAYRFAMDQQVGEDTLNGLYIYFPFTGNTIPETIQLFVFEDKDGKPDSAFRYTQTAAVIRSNNNAFIEIPFTEGVLVRDTFYIGYQETITGKPDRIRIGLDASHDTGDQLYYRNTVYHPWIQNQEVKGSLMIRPRFGKATVITNTEDGVKPFALYPNPNHGEFYLQGRADEIYVYSLTGQSVGFSSEQVDERMKITLQITTPGIYLIRYRSGRNVFTSKILVTEN